ncbi:MAG: 1-deoxy-D-xylulose-5-phosphate reductoisomerase [Jatrophihabitans sp.]
MLDAVREMDQFAATDASADGSAPRRVVLLGSTGSIGTQAIDVIRAARGQFEVVALAAGGSDLDAIVTQAIELHPAAIGVARAGAVAELRERLLAKWPTGTALPEVVDGPGAAAQLAAMDADLVLNAVAGEQGLPATLAALGTGARVALANKESLIAGGPLVLAAAAPGQLIPVDSEHSALAQGLRAGRIEDVARLIVTASGGPFRGRRRAELAEVTVADALAHPTWSMGRLITINSATLVNKGLEVIEARLLYDIGFDRIDVVVHPQSIVHSMVEYVDGSTIAAASPPDMRLPIALALAWPGRVGGAAKTFDWTTSASWTFEPLDHDLFPAVGLAYRAGEAGGCAPAVYNAANEELVAAFLEGRCGYLAITDGIDAVLARWLSDQHAAAGNPGTVGEIVQAQEWARAHAREYVAAPG